MQVKSGHVSVAQVRDLKGVLDRENAQIGVFITLNPPTRPMLQEAATAGFYVPDHFPNLRFPRLQVLTIEELFSGRRSPVPPQLGPRRLSRRLPRRQRSDEEQVSMDM